MANIDGIVAVMLFLVFVSWSFVFFFNVFSSQASQPLADVMYSISDRVVDYLTVDYYEMPVSHASSGDVTAAVFFFDHVWPSEGAKNSSRVYDSAGDQLSCNLTGDRLYWQDDAVSGDNYFKITYSNSSSHAPNCTSGDLGDPLNQTVPWSAVKTSRISQEQIMAMTAMDYSTFRNSLGVERDIRVEINISGSMTTYGLATPNSTSVYGRMTRHATVEGQQAEIRVLAW